MRNIIILFLLSCPVFAGDWVVTAGGTSPDGKLAVAVYPQKTEFIDDADETVLLINPITGRKIGPLEEVVSSGGGWGTTTTNLDCVWSRDSTLLIVNFRTGRLMQSSQIYRIRNRRAYPLTLPELHSHPKGKLIEKLETTVNPGSQVTLMKDGAIRQSVWGYIPDWSIDYSKHGLKDFEGDLYFYYRFDAHGKIQLHDIKVPPQP